MYIFQDICLLNFFHLLKIVKSYIVHIYWSKHVCGVEKFLHRR